MLEVQHVKFHMLTDPTLVPGGVKLANLSELLRVENFFEDARFLSL